jgi:hypothetical protein
MDLKIKQVTEQLLMLTSFLPRLGLSLKSNWSFVAGSMLMIGF